MQELVIHGGKTVSGTLAISGNKNAALPMIAASLLTAEEVALSNVPDISDVAAMLEAAKTFGAKITRDVAAGTVRISTPKLKSAKIDSSLAAKTRTSFLFAGPLLRKKIHYFHSPQYVKNRLPAHSKTEKSTL